MIRDLFMLFDFTYKLNSGEKLIGIARKHWFLIAPKMLKSLIIIAFLIFLANKAAYFSGNIAITMVLIFIFLVYLIYIWILWRIDYFIITSERIIRIKQQGIWSRDLNEALISEISNITLSEKGVASSLLKFGTIKINLKDGKEFFMENVSEPIKLYQGLTKLREIKKL